jgi:putative transposase
VIRFIDEHQDQRSGQLRWGIEPIARVLGIAPSTYHAARKRPPSARAVRDAELRPQILRVWEQNLAVYGADKIWHHLNHEDDVRVARCTVEWLMADMGLQGFRRGRVWIRTTEGDDRLDRPADLVERQFRAPAPNRLWVADLTYVKTHSGWVYVAFIVDPYSRMVVGSQRPRSPRRTQPVVATPLDDGGGWWCDGSSWRTGRFARRCGRRGGRSQRAMWSASSGV